MHAGWTRYLASASLILAASVGAAWSAEAADAVRLRPVDPVDVLSGTVTLHAEIDAPQGTTVSFFVNGVLLLTDPEPPYEATWTIGDRFRDHLIRVTARPPGGPVSHDVVPVPPAGPLSTATVTDRAPEWVELQVTFTESSGRPIVDVLPDELTVLEDGRRQEIELFEPDGRPVHIILLLDGSESIRSFWDLLAVASRLFSRTLRPTDRAAVAAFDKWIYELAPLGTLAEDIPKAMERHVDFGGSTRLYDAMSQSAVFLSARAHEDRRALILLTDGADSASDLRVQDVEDYLQETGTEAHSILVYPQDDDSMTYSLYKYSRLGHLRKAMKRISAASGGLCLAVEPTDLVEAFLQIAEHLRGQYRLGYTSLSRRADGAERDLQVRLRRKGVHRVHYRRAHSRHTVTEFLIAEMGHGKERRRRFALGASAALPEPAVQRALVDALAAGEDLQSGVPADARRTILLIGTTAVPYLLEATAAAEPILSLRSAIVLVELLEELTVSGGGVFVLEEVTRSLGEGDLGNGTERLRRLADLDLPDPVRVDLDRVLAVLDD